MDFKDTLNHYMEELDCSSKKLSNKSKISESVISRYRSGQRIPKENSNQIKALTTAIYEIAKEHNKEIKKSSILRNLNKGTTKNNDFDYNNFSKNLNLLITTLNINTNDMAKFIKFDASHISRIRYCKTRPSDPTSFMDKVCNYVILKFNNTKNRTSLLKLTNLQISYNYSEEDIFKELNNWLINNKIQEQKPSVNNFLKKLDTFNLNDYIQSINFNNIKIPNVPFYRAKKKNYYGIEEMKQAELDFFKATVLSKSKEDIFMYSQMPMEDMAKDTAFGKKWMYAIAISLKKGLHLNIIHNLDRPFNEMMLGLESWIPIYMTGQISPYYFKEVNNNLFNQINYTSGAAILTGECIKGYHSKGKYYVTSNKNEMKYYKEKSRLILKKATPLMNIYTKENESDYKSFVANDINKSGNRKRILSSLPLFTIDDKLLIEILHKNEISNNDIAKILKFKKQEEENTYLILNKNTIEDNIYILNEDDLKNNSTYLSLENLFFEKKIIYTYEDYSRHYKQTIKFSKKNQHYKVNIIKNKVFKNINITMLKNNYVILSKNSDPVIHFVIRHTKLVKAIENFKPIVNENYK